MLDLREVFKKHADEYNRFERVENKRHDRQDLCAFLLLHELVPGKTDMIATAGHDEIWLRVSPDALAAVATEEDVVTLIRCGVRLDRSTDSLAMFV